MGPVTNVKIALFQMSLWPAVRHHKLRCTQPDTQNELGHCGKHLQPPVRRPPDLSLELNDCRELGKTQKRTLQSKRQANPENVPGKRGHSEGTRSDFPKQRQ